MSRSAARVPGNVLDATPAQPVQQHSGRPADRRVLRSLSSWTTRPGWPLTVRSRIVRLGAVAGRLAKKRARRRARGTNPALLGADTAGVRAFARLGVVDGGCERRQSGHAGTWPRCGRHPRRLPRRRAARARAHRVLAAGRGSTRVAWREGARTGQPCTSHARAREERHSVTRRHLTSRWLCAGSCG